MDRESGREQGAKAYLDLYAGSGSTLESVIQMCREDGNPRMAVGIERGAFSPELTLERVMRAIHSETWSKGKPTGHAYPHATVYVIKLEGFDERWARLMEEP